jgi:hypothetical protein
MKLLLDECLPIDFRHLIVGHDVFTVAFMGWKGIKNGRLLALGGGDSFDALITTDTSIERQQNLSALPIAVVILHSASNDIDDLRMVVPQLLAALPVLAPKTVHHIH